MKKMLTLSTALAVLLLLFACSEEEPAVQKEQVQFIVRTPASDNAGGRSASDLPHDVKLLISLSNAQGPVLTLHEVSVLKLGGAFITEPLELTAGSYSVTDFFVVDADGEILFATPRHASPLAEAVVRALPFSFTVGKGKVSNIDMEVIDATKNTPEAFGYVSFNVNVVDPLPISVFIAQDGKMSFTEARGFIYKNGSSLPEQEFALAAKVNYISFKGAHDDLFTLVVKKEGYADFTKQFTYTNLMAELSGASLKIVLQQETRAFTITPPITEGTFEFVLGFRDTGTVSVNWGDGTIETVNFTPTDTIEIPEHASLVKLSHYYLDYNEHQVSVTGDLDQVYSFKSISVYVGQIDVSDLPNLLNLELYGVSVEELDLRNNAYLTYLSINATNFDNIEINSSALSYARLEGELNLTTADALINELYDNAIANAIDGLTLTTYHIIPELSPAAVAKVDYMEDNYNWLWTNYPFRGN
jgi:hypothetical protein